MVPKITECFFTVGPKRKGKRSINCHPRDNGRTVIGYSGTSLEQAYKDFRKQWKAFNK